MGDELSIRRATPGDLSAVLGLARDALGWTDADAAFLEWKHRDGPYGESPMWVAEDGASLVGFRAFLRWELERPDGSVVRAVRAVDTATAPAYQGRGIFTKLTLGALDELRDEGVELVFNTPNEKSLPGYLKMGWHQVGRLSVVLRPNHWRFPLTVLTARRPASRDPNASTVGEAAHEFFAVGSRLEQLLELSPTRPGLATRRTSEFLAWRYGNPSLGYRVVHTGSVDDGIAVFRIRQRGEAIEAVVCDVLAPTNDPRRSRALVAAIAGERRAHYLIRLGNDGVHARGFVPIPSLGPVLACRPLDDAPAPELRRWMLTMGDVELL